ncbi:hypothetical protein H6776_01930 [Candidatus Nomurabacteria bacterium]|nr:hypothetical protein [Candidatus Nomurabacteria bacterium]
MNMFETPRTNQQETSPEQQETQGFSSARFARKAFLTLGATASMLASMAGNTHESASTTASETKHTAAQEGLMGKEAQDFSLGELIESELFIQGKTYEESMSGLVRLALEEDNPTSALQDIFKEVERQAQENGRFIDYENLLQEPIAYYMNMAKHNPQRAQEYMDMLSVVLSSAQQGSALLIESFWSTHTSKESRTEFTGLQKEYFQLLDDMYQARKEVQASAGIANAHILNPKLGEHEDLLKKGDKQKEKLEKQMSKILSPEQQKTLIALDGMYREAEEVNTQFQTQSRQLLAQR